MATAHECLGEGVMDGAAGMMEENRMGFWENGPLMLSSAAESGSGSGSRTRTGLGVASRQPVLPADPINNKIITTSH